MTIDLQNQQNLSSPSRIFALILQAQQAARAGERAVWIGVGTGILTEPSPNNEIGQTSSLNVSDAARGIQFDCSSCATGLPWPVAKGYNEDALIEVMRETASGFLEAIQPR